MNDDGWGRPRPNFADLTPSTPNHSDDNDGREPMDYTHMEDPQHSQGQRVIALKDYPLTGYDGVPIGELNQTYASRGFLNLKKFYTTWSSGEKASMKFICIFTCPVTGEHFASGRWKNEKGVTVIVENGVESYWYNTKKIAMTAAAARALDCFSLRRCDGTEKAPWIRCLDSPYLAGNDPKLPDLPPGVVLPVALSQSNEGVHVASPPKKALYDWYLSFSKKLENVGIFMDEPANEIGPTNESYNFWTNNLDSPDTLFTAIFTCHLTGERFASGSVIGEENTYKEDFWYFDHRECMLIPRGAIINEDDDQCDSNGIGECLGLRRINFVWYKTKKKAMAAAAARAVDCFGHRDSLDDTMSDNRYCKEIPYTIENAPELWKLVSESVRGVDSGDDWASLPHDERLTSRFDVPDLHSLLEGERSEEYWRAKYRESRMTNDMTSGGETNLV